jgi:hypothetical protein
MIIIIIIINNTSLYSIWIVEVKDCFHWCQFNIIQGYKSPNTMADKKGKNYNECIVHYILQQHSNVSLSDWFPAMINKRTDT